MTQPYTTVAETKITSLRTASLNAGAHNVATSGGVTDVLHENCAIKQLLNEYHLKLITHSTEQRLLRKILHPRQEVGGRALPRKEVIPLTNQTILQVGSALPYRVISFTLS
jgi:hypothetical protein